MVQAVAIDPKTFVLAKCCAVSSLVTFPQNGAPNSLDLRQEALPCGSDQCHTKCCWHSSASAMRWKPVLLFTLFLLDDPPRAVVTIDDDDDLGTSICMYEELIRAKMELSRLRRRCGRLRNKVTIVGEGW